MSNEFPLETSTSLANLLGWHTDSETAVFVGNKKSDVLFYNGVVKHHLHVENIEGIGTLFVVPFIHQKSMMFWWELGMSVIVVINFACLCTTCSLLHEEKEHDKYLCGILMVTLQ